MSYDEVSQLESSTTEKEVSGFHHPMHTHPHLPSPLLTGKFLLATAQQES